jgi:hypothetical protein
MRCVLGQQVENSALGEGRIDACWMSTRLRCTECRKRFVGSPQAGEDQCTCSDACRVLRRRRLARERRRKDLEGYRADERERQRWRRARMAEAGALLMAQGGKSPKCHVLGSVRKSLELQEEIHRILDGPFRMSRAGFGLELQRIERKIGSMVREAVAQYGP